MPWVYMGPLFGPDGGKGPRPGRCAASVDEKDGGRWGSNHQCSRTKGLVREPDDDGFEREWCKQHAPSAERARAEKSRQAMRAGWAAEKRTAVAGPWERVLKEVETLPADSLGIDEGQRRQVLADLRHMFEARMAAYDKEQER